MSNISTQQHEQSRRINGKHHEWDNKQNKGQKEQDKFVKGLGAQPGSNSGNQLRRASANVFLHFMTLLTTAQNRPVQPAISKKRAAELQQERELDKAYQQGSTQKEQASTTKQRRGSGSKAGSSHEQPVTDSAQSTKGSAPATHPDSMDTGHSVINVVNTLQGISNKITEIYDEYLFFRDPLTFPAAAASPLPSAETKPAMTADNVPDIKNDVYIISDPQDKKHLISSLQEHLVYDRQVTQYEGADIEFWLSTTAAGSPVLIAPFNVENSSRPVDVSDNRNSGTTNNKKTECIIAKNILNSEGGSQGHIMIIPGTKNSAPLRLLNLKTDIAGSSEKNYASRKDVDQAQLLMFGLDLPAGNILKSLLLKKYPQYRDSNVCNENDKSASVRSLANTDKINNVQGEKPEYLSDITPVKNRAAFYIEDPVNGIRKEILLVLNEKDSSKGFTFLKPTGKSNEFTIWDPYAEVSGLSDKKVNFNETENTWNYVGNKSEKLNVAIIEGQEQINLYGDYYQVKKDGKGDFIVVFEKEPGFKEYIPVYRGPLSNSWKLKTHDGHFAYSNKDEEIIDKFTVNKENKFNYIKSQKDTTSYYGVKEIYESYSKDDTENYVWGQYIEMNGKIVPVRNMLHKGNKILYEAYDIKKPDEKGYPIEWNGAQWVLEGNTSVYVTPELEDRVTPEMLEKNIDPSLLSAPDSMGLRRDSEGKKYIKVKGSYLQIQSTKKDLLITKPNGEAIYLDIKNGRLHSRLEADQSQKLKPSGNDRVRRAVKNNCPTVDDHIRQLSKMGQDGTISTVRHRGDVRGHIAENSLSAFRKSYQECRPAIETDVLTTKDGELVIFHDKRIGKMLEPNYDPDRNTGPNVLLKNCDLAYLKSKNLLDPNRNPTLDKIITLQELLRDYVEQKAESLLYLEVKDPEAILSAAKTISDMAKDNIELLKRCIIKFNMAEFPTYEDWVNGLRSVGANIKIMANPVMSPNAGSRLNSSKNKLKSPKGIDLPDNASRAIYSWSAVSNDLVPNVEVVIKNSDGFKKKQL